MEELLAKLVQEHSLKQNELVELLQNLGVTEKSRLLALAHRTRMEHVGEKVFIRGLLEFSNYCSRNCLYCGLRASNSKVQRYRLTKEEILSSCTRAYRQGHRTFVLQSGEDSFYIDEYLVEIISAIKAKFPEVAVTLSVGEKSYRSYEKYFVAGADRFLLRHETASKELYTKLHPRMSMENRKRCLYYLKAIGYQVGAGFLVGLPQQSLVDYAGDLLFLQELQPQMVGIGPFIPHQDTPLHGQGGGRVEDTLLLLALTRLLLPQVLLPVTTALGTLDPRGWEKGLRAGANVVMLNISPPAASQKYKLYENKANTAEHSREIMNQIRKSGLAPDFSRGDHLLWRR